MSDTTFHAVRPFNVAGNKFAAGDEVPPGIVLDTVRRFGTDFVVEATATVVSELTKPELIEYADANGIDIDRSANKADILAAVQAATPTPTPTPED